MVRFPEAEFVSSLIFKRFLSNIWSLAPENCRVSFRTDSVAARVKEKSNRTKSYFSRNSLPRAIFWQSLGIFDFFILHAPRRYLRTAALKSYIGCIPTYISLNEWILRESCMKITTLTINIPTLEIKYTCLAYRRIYCSGILSQFEVNFINHLKIISQKHPYFPFDNLLKTLLHIYAYKHHT